MLEGEGAAARITQEASAIVQSLKNIGDALQPSNSELRDNALKLRLTEQYLAALSEIFKEAKIVGLPERASGG